MKTANSVFISLNVDGVFLAFWHDLKFNVILEIAVSYPLLFFNLDVRKSRDDLSPSFT